MRAIGRALAMTAALLASAVATGAEEQRQLGAHLHGSGRLTIAAEGQSIEIELEAPGADIAGFEHVPGTSEEKDALVKATKALEAGLELFVLPAEAACRLEDVGVEFETGEEDGDHDGHDAGHDAGHEAGAKERHAEFHARYELHCEVPEKLSQIETAYFKTFERAQSLAVEIVTGKGQDKRELSRDKPVLDLSGLM